MIEQLIEADVLVVGGGSAGSSAAIAAARSGARASHKSRLPMLLLGVAAHLSSVRRFPRIRLFPPGC